MAEKKQKAFVSPDLSKMQEVVVNMRTKIYVPLDADPEEARRKYLQRNGSEGP